MPTLELDIKLVREEGPDEKWIVNGHIKDSKDDSPIEGVEVLLYAGNGPPIQGTNSNVAGFFTLYEVVRTDSSRIIFKAEGYVVQAKDIPPSYNPI